MTVRELLDTLEGVPLDSLVVMSSDAEGNHISPLAGIEKDNNMYEADTTWSGELRLHHLTDELRERGFRDEDVSSDLQAVPCVVLWPTN